ncbi:hypothetical protein PROFUN_01150 [Planoprotostelium fungivorum]|uniref:VPS9 domain-containing protein n=1 Tax=Planoprotostelium fungivorum TaxID=1890364 RepID=A0A2P6NCI2_9EUKA|nr:hypothetical protein PROFUN_01150 [Planoprotostelium fungivorum]
MLGSSYLGGVIHRLNPFGSTIEGGIEQSPTIPSDNKQIEISNSEALTHVATDAGEDKMAEQRMREPEETTDNAKAPENEGSSTVQPTTQVTTSGPVETPTNHPRDIIQIHSDSAIKANPDALTSSTVAQVATSTYPLSSSIMDWMSFPVTTVAHYGSALYNSLPFGTTPNVPTEECTTTDLLPPILYNEFLEKLKDTPEGRELQQAIDDLVTFFERDYRDLLYNEQARRVHAFIDTVVVDGRYSNFLKNLWNHHDERMDWKEHGAECLEQIIMLKLHKMTFAQNQDMMDADLSTFQRIESLSFITTQHLDIPEKYVDNDLWSRVTEELLQLNSFLTPRDKLRCILTCCKLIFNGLHQVLSQEGGDSAATVDDFLPIFIYVLLRTNPPNLQTNLQYMSTFRHPSRMMAESGYYFVSFLTAVRFVETLDASALSIDPQQFYLLMNNDSEDLEEERTEGSMSNSFMRRTTGNLSASVDLSVVAMSCPPEQKPEEWIWVTKRGNSFSLDDQKFTDFLDTGVTSNQREGSGVAAQNIVPEATDAQRIGPVEVRVERENEVTGEDVEGHVYSVDSQTTHYNEPQDISSPYDGQELLNETRDMEELYSQIEQIEHSLESISISPVITDDNQGEKREDRFLHMEAEDLSLEDVRELLLQYKSMYRQMDER